MRWLLPRRKSVLGHHVQPSRERLMNQKYDEATGQIYIETTTPAQGSSDRDWAWESHMLKGASSQDNDLYTEFVRSWEDSKVGIDLGESKKRIDKLKDSRVKTLRGTRSLQDAAIECIVQNISDVTIDGIEWLPAPIVRRLWHAINERYTMCFNTWSIFSKVLRECDMPTLDLLRYRQVFPVPKSPLPVYTNMLTSKSLDFITCLSITVACQIPDLVKLSQVVNLGVLHIVNTTGMPDIGDRLIRAWHFAALNDGSFRVLRILKLWNHEELTCNSLPLINSFPALAVYDVRGCCFAADADIQAKALGWQVARKANYLVELNKICQERAAATGQQLGSIASYSQPWNDGARIRLISRAKVAQFIASREIGNGEEQSNLPGDPDFPDILKSKAKPSKKNSRKQKGTSIPRLASVVKATETWDFPTYAAFARIGELCNDNDLSDAGVTVGKQAVVGDELVNSVPMAFLCLGIAPPPSTKSRGFVFLRRHVISEKRTQIVEQMSRPELNEVVKPQNASHKRSAPVVMRAKKRKLDDILGSFL